MMENVEVHGTRKSRTIPAEFSGTGQPIVITDEYWYSADLHLNMLVKHNDPRTGEQTVTSRGSIGLSLMRLGSRFRPVTKWWTKRQ